ncbi:carbohydrate ABC transporter permease [Gracilibacillus salinarum]|uniref:Carbohydrate ABC transporter permease n=1 Tax=Gracilibacillus salinarum TaxID=2932255 RepID=A0ABY4GGN1_9BACI|nr:carbohydrate ABC transporter permease [Gracilibacillus salinarum]UOQ83412.1 carbohydrate ABC transporter permease [Gracilibacillus salinarum]
MRVSGLQKTLFYTVLILLVLLTIGPYYWMLVGATNPTGNMLNTPPSFIPGDYFMENLRSLLSQIDIWRSLFNSAVTAVSFTFISGIICAAAGFAFAKYQFKGRNIIFALFLLSMMVPYQALVVPQFQLFASFNLLNSYTAIILPQIAYPFAIFLMRQNMQSIPTALIEAARIDGSSETGIFFKIVLPTMVPAIAAVSIFLFTHQWNNFLWPLITITTQDMYTLPVALATLAGLETVDYGVLMMGAAISVLPIFIAFLFLQRYFIAGIIGGSVKE